MELGVEEKSEGLSSTISTLELSNDRCYERTGGAVLGVGPSLRLARLLSDRGVADRHCRVDKIAVYLHFEVRSPV